MIIKKDNSGHYSQPVIKHQVEVLSIKIYNHCTLNVAENGSIFIDGDSFYTEGIEVIGGKLINQGSIVMNNVDGDYSDQLASEGDNKTMIVRKEFTINGSRIPAK